MKNGNFPTYCELSNKFRIDVQHYFGRGMQEIYECAGVKNRKQAIADKILEFVKRSAQVNCYPNSKEIERTLHINVRTYFSSIFYLYNEANIEYPSVHFKKK